MVTALDKVNTETGFYISRELVATETLPTRGRAKTKAIKWVRYFKSEFNRVNKK